MTDDDLDRHLRDVLASVIPPSDSLSETVDKYLAARDRLRLAIDAAVRAEQTRIANIFRDGRYCRRADHVQGACECSELATAIESVPHDP